MVLKLILNFSLIFTLLLAPVALVASYWSGKRFQKTVFSWNIPEMVIITIIYFIFSLLLVIISVSCLFSHFGDYEAIALKSHSESSFLLLAISCLTCLVGLSIFYYALRRILVNRVLKEGICIIDKVSPLPESMRYIQWSEIVDFYVIPDYPNAVCNVIVKEEDLLFNKIGFKIPVFLKDEVISYIEERMNSEEMSELDDSIISKSYFSEN